MIPVAHNGSRLPRPSRQLLLAAPLPAALLLLVCLVALGASAQVGSTGGTSVTPVLRAGATLAAVLAGTLALAGLAMLIWMLAAPRLRHNGDLAEEEPDTLPLSRLDRFAATALGLFLMGVIAAMVWLIIHAHSGGSTVTAVPPPFTGSAQGSHPPNGNASTGVNHGPDIAVILGGIALLVVAALAIALFITLSDRRARRSAPGDRAMQPAAATPMGSQGIDPALVADPRQAVLVAYRHVEATMESRGLARSAIETPHEFLGRTCAAQAELAAPMSTITALFERARFSSHPISPQMRLTAIEQAHAVRSAPRQASVPQGPLP